MRILILQRTYSTVIKFIDLYFDPLIADKSKVIFKSWKISVESACFIQYFKHKFASISLLEIYCN